MYKKLKELLIANSYALYINRKPEHEDSFHILEPGDLVLEISSINNRLMDNKRIGYFIEKSSNGKFTIQNLEKGALFYWDEDAVFIKLPQDVSDLI